VRDLRQRMFYTTPGPPKEPGMPINSVEHATVLAIASLATLFGTDAVCAQSAKASSEPLTIASQGSFFVGGESIESIEELYKQMIPDLNAQLPAPNPTWTNMAALAQRLQGAVLMGHSESGFFPEQAALIDPSGIRGMISIEQQCPQDLSAEQVAQLAKIPTLMMFGDHLGDVTGSFIDWQASFEGCQALVDRMNTAGGHARMIHLPKLGIEGNSHMLMQDKNNLVLADLILDWIDTQVERH
jgi:hypothetical protein